MSIIDNLYTIIGIAATKFNSEQLDYLLSQIIQTWNNSSFKLHDKLVNLLKIIGREAKSIKTTTKVNIFNYYDTATKLSDHSCHLRRIVSMASNYQFKTVSKYT